MKGEPCAKLTPTQNKYLWMLQNRWELCTGNGYAILSKAHSRYPDVSVGLKTFWVMVRKGYIYQMLSPPFWYVITKKGMDTPTKVPRIYKDYNETF